MQQQNQYTQDGWQHNQHNQIDNFNADQQIQSIRYHGQKGLNILQAKHHSLEPDMISGWRPKLPSCPLPLSYPNAYVDSLITHLGQDDTYSIAYLGPRYINSVQINQKYQYYWRYRQRYSLNLAIIQQAVRNVGHSGDNQQNKLTTAVQSKYKFDSAFQSGNLDLAVRVKRNQYDCFVRSDTNTKGHTNWYYFKLENNQQIGNVKINICNMTKCRNLYSKGMKPYVKIGKQGKWSQDYCYDVVFVERYCRYGFDRKTYQLQFLFNFTQVNQVVYFAYSIPYTYTDLENFIKEIKSSHSKIVTTKKLCQSLGGIQLPLLTITNNQNNPDQSENSPSNQIAQPSASQYTPIKKKAILITARIHPGQSNSSYMMQGFIRQLLTNTQASNILRSMFVFYIVPMLNPDGVIAGNFRTSYSGKDLNRQFNRLNKYVFPQITALCDFVQNIKKSAMRGIQFYFDFHGHSAKKNLFCYGPQHPTTKSYFFKSRALAKIIQKINPIFSYRKSIFTISQPKKNTGRAYMLRNMKIPMTFTFQISNGIYQSQNKVDILLNKKILLQTGQVIAKGLFRYAQLEMKIPKKCVKAKVDTGKFPKRHLNSAGASRTSNNILKKKSSHQQSCQIQPKDTKSISIDKSLSLQKPLNTSLTPTSISQTNKQFLCILKQIKQQQQNNQHVQIQGDSDSETQGEDFTKQQFNNLFTQIIKRNTQTSSSNYIIRDKKKIKTVKLNYKKKQSQEDEQQNTLRQKQPPVQKIQKDNKKIIRFNRMLELSKPPIPSNKNIKRGVSVEFDKVVLAQKNFTLFL